MTEDNLKDRSAQNREIARRESEPSQPDVKREVEEVLRAPGMDSPEIPVDPTLFEPFTRRPADPREIEVRLRMMNALWKTPLGQMLWFYLTENAPPVEVPSYSRQFVRRVFSGGNQVPTRINAIHLLISDLYVRGKIGPERARRIAILQNDLSQESAHSSSTMKDRAVQQAAAFFLFSLPFGSPVVRQEAGKIVKKLWAAMKGIVGGERGRIEASDFKRLFSAEVLNNYQPGAAANMFFATFGPYSTIYFFYADWLTAAIGENSTDTKLLFGLDILLEAMAL